MWLEYVHVYIGIQSHIFTLKAKFIDRDRFIFQAFLRDREQPPYQLLPTSKRSNGYTSTTFRSQVLVITQTRINYSKTYFIIHVDIQNKSQDQDRSFRELSRRDRVIKT